MGAACKTNIIEFKKKNIRNFLNSVKVALDEFEETDVDCRKKVIEYARARVDNDIVISQNNYADFDSFKKDVLKQFKPPMDTLQITQAITLLRQEFKESDRLVTLLSPCPNFRIQAMFSS